ncbi:hypothetical protein CGSHi3655_00824 [Haemophilus influenzae 3655]|uniref:Uncharacterized protein n=1 Tax=Haemophilus influenzae (strain NTHi 3655) TaxID=375177 RepID=A0A0H3PK43_HAEI3|nr:hypothetical protein CGSHi3655_00824 [Haemophilus influenzae 3655]EEP47143.1 hypothetical protein CGSHi6P18H1_07632 [Haemophilus influenzae 6P18H1]
MGLRPPTLATLAGIESAVKKLVEIKRKMTALSE